MAAFASVVSGTFGAVYDEGGALNMAASVSQARVAMVSILFIAIAIIFGLLVYRRNMPMGAATILGILSIIVIIVIGMNFHPIYLSSDTWMWIVGVYIVVASVTPVWILLQPRDYLSSFLLYSMLALAVVAVFVARPSMDSLPLIKAETTQYPLFPILFTTIACGAISGFHSLVSSGTTSKQLDKETDAKPIAYGGMLLECVLALLALCAIAYAYTWNAEHPEAKLTGAAAIFGGGIAGMLDPGRGHVYEVLYTLLVLAYSAFCLTSLDTATRLGRFMFQEFWLDGSKGETPETVTGWKKILANPYFANIFTVLLGIALGMNGYEKLWSLFGSANQLLAALGLMAVAAWLSHIGRNNKMLILPMLFMLVVTISALVINTKEQLALISSGGADWAPYVQTAFGILLIILAIVLAIEGISVISRQLREKKASK